MALGSQLLEDLCEVFGYLKQHRLIHSKRNGSTNFAIKKMGQFIMYKIINLRKNANKNTKCNEKWLHKDLPLKEDGSADTA